MPRTIGKMKVAVFEAPIEDRGGYIKALAQLLGEAAEWLRGEAITEVKVSSKGPWKYHQMWNFQLTLVVDDDEDQPDTPPVAQLYIHYDDNEKE